MAGLEWQARRGKLVLFSYVLSMEIQGRCLEPSSAACPEPFKCHGASASLKRLAASGSLLWTLHVVLPTTLAPFLWSIFPFPDVTEVIQAENVFGSLCICSTTNIKVSSLLVTRNNPTLPPLPTSPPRPHPATGSPCSLGQISSLSLLAASTNWHSRPLCLFLCGLDG